MNNEKLDELEKLMSRHNWNYMYSEDAGQYQRGMETERAIARLSEELRRNGYSSEVVKLWERFAK